MVDRLIMLVAPWRQSYDKHVSFNAHANFVVVHFIALQLIYTLNTLEKKNLTSNQLNRIVINIFMDNCVTIRSRHLEYTRSKMYYNFSVCVTIKKTIYLTEGISGFYFLIWVLALFTSWRFLTSVKCLMSFKT